MLLDVSEARQSLLEALPILEPEEVPLEKTIGRVLAEQVIAITDLPPFSNSSMDGFAARAEDLQTASRHKPVTLKVVGDLPAGNVTATRLQAGQAMRIMTGAPVPDGADVVVPVEDTDFDHREAGVHAPEQVQVFRALPVGAYVRLAGEDLRRGAIVFSSGHVLRSQDIGMLATLGKPMARVIRRPRVALISTGDELLPVEADLEPGKIRESNSYTLACQVASCGAMPKRLGIVPDEEKAVQAALDRAVEEGADMIVSSAGVSVGAYDFVRSVVEQHGELSFWRVNMRPGKPLVFGHYRQVPFVGLPGNPVSAFVGFEVFLRPALMKMGGVRGWRRVLQRATLQERVTSDGRESYLRGILSEEGGVNHVRLTGHQGSGNLFSLVQANALVIVPAGITALPAGSEVDVWPL